MIVSFFKEWPVDVWIVALDGYPVDYAFSRSKAFQMANRKRELEPGFWSVFPAKATLSIKRSS